MQSMAIRLVTPLLKSRAGVAMLTGLASLTGAAIAFATIPGADGMIHGCYSNSNGDLRVIDDAIETCRPNETAIAWSQSGIIGYEVITETQTAPPAVGTVARARCTSGKRVLGGGYQQPGGLEIDQSFPQLSGPSANSWQVLVTNHNTLPLTFTAYAVCAIAGP
jgi:hypothetical protein